MINDPNNGIISEAARQELTDPRKAGSGLTGVEDSAFYTVKTTYNNKNYIGITGKNGAGNLDNAGRSMFFFEADATGFPVANAEIAFKVHFQNNLAIADVVGADNNSDILQGLLNNKAPQLRIGMTEPNSSAHISIKGTNLSNYSYVTSANMSTSGTDVVLNIEINNAKFTHKTDITALNNLTLGSKLLFKLDGSDDTITLTINDLNNTAKSLFKDSEGKIINGDNFEEVAAKFTEFFNGGSLKVKTSSGVEIDVEQNDLRSTSVMDNAIISNVNHDNIEEIMNQLEAASDKLLANLSSFTSTDEIVDSNIASTTQQMESQETSLASIENADIAEESQAFQAASRQRVTQEKLFNVINTYTNNIENNLMRTLEDNIRNMN
jgi:hypothetical protein